MKRKKYFYFLFIYFFFYLFIFFILFFIGGLGEGMRVGGGLGRHLFLEGKKNTRQVWTQQNKEIKWVLRKY